MLATQRLKDAGATIEPRGTPYLAVRKDEEFESVCTKCVCVLDN